MNEMQKYEDTTKQVDLINEFTSVFAEQGVVFSQQEIDIIFRRYATKFINLIEHIDKGETK